MPMQIGQQLPKVEKLVTQNQIEKYAHASGDFNPVHLNQDFAASTPFGKTIAHGMLILAFLSEMMTQAFKEDWLNSGRLKVRFKAPVYPDDRVTTYGTIKEIQRAGDVSYAACVVGCKNQKGEDVIVGEAWAPITN